MPDTLADTLEDYAERWGELDDRERGMVYPLLLRAVVCLERRSGALVVEREHPDGSVDVRAKRTGLSAGTILAILGALAPFYAATLAVIFR